MSAMSCLYDDDEEALLFLEEQLRDSEGFEGSVANVASADAIIGSILKNKGDGGNLSSVLDENNKQLDSMCDAYVEAHVAEAEAMVEWYYDVTAVEDELLGFEKEIEKFQSQLTDTAEDIVSMQAETLSLMRRVDNRKVVSQRLKRVYDALNECEEFCTNIAEAGTVDDGFMVNIRELESKISFLTDNADLKRSAIHDEIHPKLQASAVRAGDKLHDYLISKFHMLAEEGTNVAVQQQAMERQGQYSYLFLAKYNPPIARDLYTSYLRIVSDVHAKSARLMVKELAEITPYTSQGFEPVLPNSVLRLLHEAEKSTAYPTQPGCALHIAELTKAAVAAANHAAAAAANNSSGQRSASVATPTPAASLTGGQGGPSSRSVSLSIGQRLNKFKDQIQNKIDAERVPSTYEDTIRCVQSISFEHQLLHLDPVLHADLKSTTCWLSRFADSMCKMVNAVIGESKFISHFFFAAGDDSMSDDEEQMLRQLISVALDNFFEPAVLQAVNQLTDPFTLMGAMRVVELAKNCVSQTPDPLPLLILASPFESIHSATAKKLASHIQVHLGTLSQANNLSFAAFKGDPTMSFAARIESGRSSSSSGSGASSSEATGFLHSLGPHEVTMSFDSMIGRLELLNALPLIGSRVSHITARYVFDDRISGQLAGTFNEYKKLLEKLSKRQDTEQGQQVFMINNIAAILLRWRCRRRSSLLQENQHLQGAFQGAFDAMGFGGNSTLNTVTPAAAAGGGGGSPAREGSPSGVGHDSDVAPDSPIGARRQRNQNEEDHHISSIDVPSTQQSPIDHLLQTTLKARITAFILQDVGTSSLATWYKHILQWKQQLGPVLLAGNPTSVASDGGGEEDDDVQKYQPSDLIGTDVNEADVLATATNFHRVWKEAMVGIGQRVGGYFRGLELDSSPATKNATTTDNSSSTKRDLVAEEKALIPQVATWTARMVLQCYFELVLENNKVLLQIAKAYFDGSSTLQAKLVGHVTLTHAATHELRLL